MIKNGWVTKHDGGSVFLRRRENMYERKSGTHWDLIKKTISIELRRWKTDLKKRLGWTWGNETVDSTVLATIHSAVPQAKRPKQRTANRTSTKWRSTRTWWRPFSATDPKARPPCRRRTRASASACPTTSATTARSSPTAPASSTSASNPKRPTVTKTPPPILES